MICYATINILLITNLYIMNEYLHFWIKKRKDIFLEIYWRFIPEFTIDFYTYIYSKSTQKYLHFKHNTENRDFIWIKTWFMKTLKLLHIELNTMIVV